MTSFSIKTGDSYDKRFDVYREKSGERFKDIEILQSRLPAVVSKVLQESSRSAIRDSFDVLSIGSGTGEIDFEILKTIKTELQSKEHCSQMKVFNRAIEPNEHNVSAYKASIGNFKVSLGNQITFDLLKNTFEGYKDTKGDPARFDIVHFIRSIYYVDPEQTFLDCFERELNDNGIIVCVLAGSEDLISLIHKMLWPTGKPLESEPFKLQDVESIVKIADKHGWMHEVFTEKYAIDVTEILDEKSIEGNLLLDFFTHKMNYRETADKQQLNKTLALIRKETIVKDGKYFGKKSSNIVFIYK